MINSIQNSELQPLVNRLHAEDCSCVIANGDDVRVFYRRGVKDLYDLLNNDREYLHGAVIADKVVGKAAAALMVLGVVKCVFADVISQQAYNLFLGTDIRVEYALLVPHIINRTQTDWCPLEKRCFGAPSVGDCLVQIEEFITSVNLNL